MHGARGGEVVCGQVRVHTKTLTAKKNSHCSVAGVENEEKYKVRGRPGD